MKLFKFALLTLKALDSLKSFSKPIGKLNELVCWPNWLFWSINFLLFSNLKSSEKVLIEEFKFPVDKYPIKVKSLNLFKTPNYEGKLTGIKGQYLIFEDQTVFNVRSNEGQKIKLVMNN